MIQQLNKFIDNFKLLISCIPIVTLILGSLWAHHYYSLFNINFFRISNALGAFNFLFSNAIVVALTLAIVLISCVYIAFGSILMAKLITWLSGRKKSPEDLIPNDKEIAFESKLDKPPRKKLKIFIRSVCLSIGAILLMQLIYAVISTFTDSQVTDIKKLAQARSGEAVNIYLSSSTTPIAKCLYPIGKVGEYSAFITADLKPKLIKDSAISHIEYPFLPLTYSDSKTGDHIRKDDWNVECL